MILSTAVRRQVATASTSAARSRRGMSTAAATTVSSDVQSYISEAPTATVSTLGNGVTVASLYSADG